MKEPGGPFQRCLATCARERAAREAEEKEAKKFEEYLYANVNLETGEMLAPEEAPSLLPAGDAPAAAAAAAAAAAPARRPRARRRRAERQAPPRPRRRRERAQAPAPRGRAAVLQPDVPEPRAHERLLALVAGRLGGGCCASGVTLARWVPDRARVPFTCVRASRFPLLTASSSASLSFFVAAAARGHRVRQVRPGGVVLVAPLPVGLRPRLVRRLLRQGGACAHPDRPGSDALSARDRSLTTRLSPPFPRSRPTRGARAPTAAPRRRVGGGPRPPGSTRGSPCATRATPRAEGEREEEEVRGDAKRRATAQ